MPADAPGGGGAPTAFKGPPLNEAAAPSPPPPPAPPPAAGVEEEDAGACDIETALSRPGVGVFQVLALAVCGCANAADAVEILGMSLVLPAANDDPAFELGQHGKAALSSCIFLGMLLGGLFGGAMGDAVGRRLSLLVALSINGLFGLFSAGARGVGPLVALRLLSGVGVGASVPVVFAYMAELVPAHARGRYMVGLAAHWMVGSIFSAGVGWAIIPRGPSHWRLFLAIASLPAWLAAAGTWLLPESPRHLLVQGHTAAAEQVLARMARVNGARLQRPIRLLPHQSAHRLPSAAPAGTPSPTPPPAAGAAQGDLEMSAWHHGSSSSPQRGRRSRSGGHGGGVTGGSSAGGGGAAPAAGPQRAAGGSERAGQQRRRQQRRCCASSLSAARMLLRPPLRQRFLPLLVAWLGLCGGWYSTVLWIPEFFKARGAGEVSLYAQTFAVALANLPGNIASVFLVDRFGRRLTACACLAGSCVAALAFAFAPADPRWSVTAACVFNAISVGGWNALDLLSAELFATEVRSTAMGLLGAGGRLASFATTFLAGWLMQLLLWSPLLVAAALLAAGSAAVMLLPEMAHRPLEDTVEDACDSEVVTVLSRPTSGSGRRGSAAGGSCCGAEAGQRWSGGGGGAAAAAAAAAAPEEALGLLSARQQHEGEH